MRPRISRGSRRKCRNLGSMLRALLTLLRSHALHLTILLTCVSNAQRVPTEGDSGFNDPIRILFRDDYSRRTYDLAAKTIMRLWPCIAHILRALADVEQPLACCTDAGQRIRSPPIPACRCPREELDDSAISVHHGEILGRTE